MGQPLQGDARAAQKQDTRDRLLQVAVALFAREGVDAVTVEQIAREAQTSRANFYLHFSGKSELLNAMRRQMWRVAQDFYDAFAELPDTSEPTLLGWLRQLADAWARDADRTRAILGATHHEIRVEYTAHLKDYIAALTRDRSKWPGLSDEEAKRRAHLLIIQLAGFLSDLHVYEMPMDREAMLCSFAAGPARGGKASPVPARQAAGITASRTRSDRSRAVEASRSSIVSRDGRVAARFSPDVPPDAPEVLACIETALLNLSSTSARAWSDEVIPGFGRYCAKNPPSTAR